MDNARILIIIPTYNERENIVLLVPEIKRALPEAHLLVVDDSSPDNTATCVRELAETVDNIFLLSRPKKEGLGRAYISGFKWAIERSYEFIFEMDADFSHDPKYLHDFLAAAVDTDLVLGSRYLTGVNVINWPLYRLLISYCGNLYARLVTGLPVRDCTGGFKCFRRKVLEAIDLDRISASGYSFQIEMSWLAWKKGFRIREIPIVFVDRKSGESKMSTKIFREGLLLIWRLRLASLFKRK
ncbi:MAG: polyprenol monophosphomannose synthase [Chitinispirillaceae bacterium]|nr:polyprenol monophosphomannose synthase [Chitinispirillaceae bacterium]